MDKQELCSAIMRNMVSNSTSKQCTCAKLTEHTEPIVHGDHDDISVGCKDAPIEHVPWALHERAAMDEKHHWFLAAIPNIWNAHTHLQFVALMFTVKHFKPMLYGTHVGKRVSSFISKWSDPLVINVIELFIIFTWATSAMTPIYTDAVFKDPEISSENYFRSRGCFFAQSLKSLPSPNQRSGAFPNCSPPCAEQMVQPVLMPSVIAVSVLPLPMQHLWYGLSVWARIRQRELPVYPI